MRAPYRLARCTAFHVILPMSPADPQTLVRQAQAGDRAAFEQLIALYRQRLGTVVYLRLGALVRQRVDADDVLQETFSRALASLSRFEWQGNDCFFAWIRGIAEHVILEEANRQKRRRAQELPEDAAAELTSQSHALRREERFERLKAALKTLTPDHRRVILLSRLQGVPVKDVAVLMNRSPDAVTNLLARALERLRQEFGDTDSLHLPDRLLLETLSEVDDSPAADEGR
jgi:RNA polymerase sigma-70 factor (ECF subfamily)